MAAYRDPGARLPLGRREGSLGAAQVLVKLQGYQRIVAEIKGEYEDAGISTKSARALALRRVRLSKYLGKSHEEAKAIAESEAGIAAQEEDLVLSGDQQEYMQAAEGFEGADDTNECEVPRLEELDPEIVDLWENVASQMTTASDPSESIEKNYGSNRGEGGARKRTRRQKRRQIKQRGGAFGIPRLTAFFRSWCDTIGALYRQRGADDIRAGAEIKRRTNVILADENNLRRMNAEINSKIAAWVRSLVAGAAAVDLMSNKSAIYELLMSVLDVVNSWYTSPGSVMLAFGRVGSMGGLTSKLLLKFYLSFVCWNLAKITYRNVTSAGTAIGNGGLAIATANLIAKTRGTKKDDITKAAQHFISELLLGDPTLVQTLYNIVSGRAPPQARESAEGEAAAPSAGGALQLGSPEGVAQAPAGAVLLAAAAIDLGSAKPKADAVVPEHIKALRGWVREKPTLKKDGEAAVDDAIKKAADAGKPSFVSRFTTAISSAASRVGDYASSAVVGFTARPLPGRRPAAPPVVPSKLVPAGLLQAPARTAEQVLANSMINDELERAFARSADKDRLKRAVAEILKYGDKTTAQAIAMVEREEKRYEEATASSRTGSAATGSAATGSASQFRLPGNASGSNGPVAALPFPGLGATQTQIAAYNREYGRGAYEQELAARQPAAPPPFNRERYLEALNPKEGQPAGEFTFGFKFPEEQGASSGGVPTSEKLKQNTAPKFGPNYFTGATFMNEEKAPKGDPRAALRKPKGSSGGARKGRKSTQKARKANRKARKATRKGRKGNMRR